MKTTLVLYKKNIYGSCYSFAIANKRILYCLKQLFIRFLRITKNLPLYNLNNTKKSSFFVVV